MVERKGKCGPSFFADDLISSPRFLLRGRTADATTRNAAGSAGNVAEIARGGNSFSEGATQNLSNCFGDRFPYYCYLYDILKEVDHWKTTCVGI